MKFSIIVVCLNPGTKLNQTLDSILTQTYSDFEIASSKTAAAATVP